jgi:LysR family hca operon transcriptional activator
VGEIFIGGANMAAVLRAAAEDYLRRSGVDIKLDHGVNNMAMAMSLVASTRGLALMPAYAKNLLPGITVDRVDEQHYRPTLPCPRAASQSPGPGP